MSLGKKDTESYSRALCLFKLLVLRHGVLRVPGCDISARDCKTAICYLCNGWCLIWPFSHVCVSVFFCSPDCLCFIFLYFEYDVIINK